MKCRICGCTDERACPPGCHWAAIKGKDRDICSVCAAFRAELEQYFGDCAGISNASLIRLWVEVQEKLGLR